MPVGATPTWETSRARAAAPVVFANVLPVLALCSGLCAGHTTGSGVQGTARARHTLDTFELPVKENNSLFRLSCLK